MRISNFHKENPPDHNSFGGLSPTCLDKNGFFIISTKGLAEIRLTWDQLSKLLKDKQNK